MSSVPRIVGWARLAVVFVAAPTNAARWPTPFGTVCPGMSLDQAAGLLKMIEPAALEINREVGGALLASKSGMAMVVSSSASAVILIVPVMCTSEFEPLPRDEGLNATLLVYTWLKGPGVKAKRLTDRRPQRDVAPIEEVHRDAHPRRPAHADGAGHGERYISGCGRTK